MTSQKCDQCGLINFFGAEKCRRCSAVLIKDARTASVQEPAVVAIKTHGIGYRLLWLAGVTVTLIFIWSRSLLLTSDAIDARQRHAVMQAIALLEHTGFSREVLVLRHFANYRATDNWWNLYVGHPDAYAATNFPLGVVTLYPPFFTAAVDDTERAAILLHEAQHLPWFYRTLRNAAIDQFRRRGTASRAVEAFAHEIETSVAPEPEMESEICACVTRLTATLKPEYAEALQAIDVEGAAVKTFAEQIMSPPGC